MPIDAVIWDLGGVLVRTEDRSYRVVWEEKLGLEKGELDRLVFEGEAGRAAAIGKANAADIWLVIRDRFELSADEAQAIERDFWAGDVVDYMLIAMIRELRVSYKTGLLSNGWPDLRHALEDVWEIADAFDEIIISAEVGFAKPEEKIYQLALDRLGVIADRTIFIDDFTANVDAASAMGMQTIHFQNADQAQAQLKSMLAN